LKQETLYSKIHASKNIIIKTEEVHNAHVHIIDIYPLHITDNTPAETTKGRHRENENKNNSRDM
jgi:hypothetical protein